MRVILHQDVANLGKLGEIVRVRPGFARNYLIPQGFARRASDESVAEFESKRADFAKAQQERLARLRGAGDALAGRRVLIEMKAAPDGKLYGSVGTRAVAAALAVDGLDKSRITLAGGAIKAVGAYPATVAVSAEVAAAITVVVYPEGSRPPAEPAESAEDEAVGGDARDDAGQQGAAAKAGEAAAAVDSGPDDGDKKQQESSAL